MAYHPMFLGSGRGTQDYETFNNVAMQATVNTYLPHRVLPTHYENPTTAYSRETIPPQRDNVNGVHWDTVKYVQVNDASKYIQLTPQINDTVRYATVNENFKCNTANDLGSFSNIQIGLADCLTASDQTGQYQTTPSLSSQITKETPHFTLLPDNPEPTVPREPAIKRLHKCSVCEKLLSSAGALKTHMLSHSDEKPFQCHLCNKRFASSTGHQRHVICHAGVRQFKCETCEKTFVLKTALRQHEKIHEGIQKPYKCEICQCTFRFPFRLKEHQRLHTGERPFVCNVCGKSFRVNRLLAKHKDIHSGKVKSYNTTCKRKASPRKECPVCHQKFADVSVHLRTHNIGKSFKCSVCDKTFKHKSNALSHMRRVHGEHDDVEELQNDDDDIGKEIEKTFQCPTCKRMFALEWSLTMHRTLVHKDPSE